MDVPVDISALIWISFSAAILVVLSFSVSYIQYFRSRYDSEVSCIITSILGLAVVLLASLLLPVDVSLVSFMKTSNGTFQDWAANTTMLNRTENSVLYAYYAIYGIMLLFAFIVLPLVYFFYEEKDDDMNNIAERLCTSVKYTLVFLITAVILILLGLFVHWKDEPPKNSTEWEKLKFLFEEVAVNRGEEAFSFILNVLTLIGMITLLIYTGYGLSVWPVEMVKGTQNLLKEHSALREQKTATADEITALKEKRRTKKLSSREQALLTELEESQHLIERQERHINIEEKSWIYKCSPFIRVFQVILGIISCGLAFLIWISLLLSNIDKLINSLGYKMGYILTVSSIPNPLDLLLVKTQQVFPLDYIIYALLTLLLVVTTISGVQKVGLWFLCVKMYQIRKHRTSPQGLLMLCLTLMYTVLGINILMYNVSPQYTMYGNQHYWANETINNLTSYKLKQCTVTAPPGECILTRASYLLSHFIYKAWFFGACYYWATWLFLLVAVIGFFVAIVQQRASAIEGAVNRDDFEESDDDDLIRA